MGVMTSILISTAALVHRDHRNSRRALGVFAQPVVGGSAGMARPRPGLWADGAGISASPTSALRKAGAPEGKKGRRSGPTKLPCRGVECWSRIAGSIRISQVHDLLRTEAKLRRVWKMSTSTARNIFRISSVEKFS